MLRRTGSRAGLIVIDRHGRVGHAFTTERMAWAQVGVPLVLNSIFFHLAILCLGFTSMHILLVLYCIFFHLAILCMGFTSMHIFLVLYSISSRLAILCLGFTSMHGCFFFVPSLFKKSFLFLHEEVRDSGRGRECIFRKGSHCNLMFECSVSSLWHHRCDSHPFFINRWLLAKVSSLASIPRNLQTARIKEEKSQAAPVIR